MKVVLIGVGADTTNASPTPPVYSDNRFEYIPIPESNGPGGTTENKTFGNTYLRHQNIPMAEYLDHIKPGGEGPKIRDKKLSKWPLHYDPNFEALTYGETRSRGAYVKKLKNLNEGDLVAFYTGLRRKGDQNRRKHRYIIGYFTVNEAVNFERLNLEGREVSFRDLSPKRKRGLMEQHRNNAHAKRFEATGEIYGGDGLVIVDGKKPGGLLDTAFRISKFTDTGHYYLTDELQDAFSPEPSGRPERNAYLGGIKQAHTLNINPNDFMDIVDSNGA